ncbi:transmembrane protein 201-like [Rhincodon typus]|uniref:transmembrane protein 201-like n=1 Tax=Rhincodon typus TaxID=259920 RepID=UPI00202E3B10|nr:transmembrane protein 201-like [Rhincodon typus]
MPGRSKAFGIDSTVDSGYLFSGSRPPSQTAISKDSPPSDYFSLKSGSRPSSPSISPTPSVAGSVTSSSGSLHHRRPLISPARLNLTGQRLRLFTEHVAIKQRPGKLIRKAWPSPNMLDTNVSSNVLAQDVTHVSSHSHNAKSAEGGSVYSETTGQRKDSSSRSSACVVDTTTNVGQQVADSARGWKGLCGNILWTSLLGLSLTANVIFASVYLYQGLH